MDKQSERNLSKRRILGIREQGYFEYTDAQIAELAFGNSFAYKICSILLILGVATASKELLTLLEVVAFLGVVLPYHPFDYFYNHFLRYRMAKPKLPKRSNQSKFACTVVTLWIGTIITFFCTGMPLVAYLLGGMLSFGSVLAAFFDTGLASKVYNKVLGMKVKAL